MKNKEKDRKKYLHDLVLVAVCLLVAGGVWLCVTLSKKPGACAVVTVDGIEKGRYSLSVDTSVDIKTENGENTLVISDGKADMTDADCPDKLCVRQHAVSRTGETIVCLPHKVVVTVEGEGASDTDGIDMVG